MNSDSRDSMEAAFLRIRYKAGVFDSHVQPLLEQVVAVNGEEQGALTAMLAAEHIRECEHYRPYIKEFTEDELDAFVWLVVMQLDLVRQLVPGFLNNGIPELNEMLQEYENSLFKDITAMYDR